MRRSLVLLLICASCGSAVDTDAPDTASPTDTDTVEAPSDTPASEDTPSDTDTGQGCDLTLATSETCNGLDDDCDGNVDNGVCGLGDSCATDAECPAGACLATGTVPVAWSPPVCSQPCTIFADADNDRVNDADAPGELCNTSALPFRCVNIAPVGQNPVAMCLPGETLAVCEDASTCAPGEQCVEVFAPFDVTKRCVR